jgi:hypothetical protein
LFGKKKEGEKAGRGGIRAAAAAGRRGRGRRKEGEDGEADEWGPGVNDSKRKEKERGRGGPVRGEGRWAAGPVGPKGEKGEVFFFSFLFQTSFKTTISFQIQIKTLSNFFSKIYKLF